jgi:hypothetical protein
LRRINNNFLGQTDYSLKSSNNQITNPGLGSVVSNYVRLVDWFKKSTQTSIWLLTLLDAKINIQFYFTK